MLAGSVTTPAKSCEQDVTQGQSGRQPRFARCSTRPRPSRRVNAALRRLGYDKVTMTGHGFRAMASTRLNELGWAPDVIERQLAHAERNAVRKAYNRAQYMKERRLLMSAWADYLDLLKADTSKVIPIRRKAPGGSQ